MFLSYGFKSVTMDDIATDLGISKKTIYKYFKNKEVLVDESATFIHQNIQEKMEEVRKEDYNAIRENFEIKKKINQLFGNLEESPSYQLEKYYPDTFNKITCDKNNLFKSFINSNLSRGINEGLYRENIQKEIISDLYFLLSTSIHLSEELTDRKKIKLTAIEYHIRAIATDKGLKILEKQIKEVQ